MNNTAQNMPRMTAEEYFKQTAETTQPTELLDGEIFNQAAPSIRHQRISMKLASRLDAHIEKNHGKCQTFTAPTDVKLDEFNVVQPDVFITCKPEQLTEQYLDGAPDFICEIVSSNRSDDYIRKLYLYRISGVREYWIIDPFQKKTLVYFFDEGNHPTIYPFDTPIPVHIWEGRLSITVAELEIL